MPRPISVSTSIMSNDDGVTSSIVVLCDDGTLWQVIDHRWSRLTHIPPFPMSEEVNDAPEQAPSDGNDWDAVPPPVSANGGRVGIQRLNARTYTATCWKADGEVLTKAIIISHRSSWKEEGWNKVYAWLREIGFNEMNARAALDLALPNDEDPSF